MHPADPRHPEPRRPPRVELVPKPGGGMRALTGLDPDDAWAYRSVVERVASRVEAALGPAVIADRVAGTALRLEDHRIAHRRWRRVLRARDGGWLMADVRDCFGSIRPAVVVDALEEMHAPSRGVGSFLGALGERGLPVGPEPSAVLANAVLARVDLAIARAGFGHMRWVDDLAIRVEGRRDAIRALDTVWRALHPLGLELNERKTRLIGGREQGPVSLARRRARPCDDAGP